MSDSLIHQAAAVIKDRAGTLKPKLALVLGSGLGAVAELLENAVTIPFADIPGFPPPTVSGHEGSVRIGTVSGVPVMFIKGRKHLYEGPSEAAVAIKTVVRTLKLVGIEVLFLTNAAGSLRAEYGPGSLVAISDHINLTGFSPLAGPNDDEWGPRFPPMENAWDGHLRALLLKAAQDAGVSALGEGVYIQLLGPTFETPAEIRMCRAIGADTVGMSTAVENIVARHCGLKVVGVSAITNLAAGMSDESLSHEQTLQGAKLAEQNMATTVKAFIQSWAAQPL